MRRGCLSLALCLMVAGSSVTAGAGVTTAAPPTGTGQTLEVCFNYGCATRVPVLFLADELTRVGALFDGVRDAEDERERLADALAALYRLIGGQTPVFADLAGNRADEEREGRMDCIDHSTTTTRLLALMAEQGWLRHHAVREPARRGWFLSQHFSAVIEARPAPLVASGGQGGPDWPDHIAYLLALCDCPEVVHDAAGPGGYEPRPDHDEAGPLFAVDSWFVDHAEPPVIMPLADWMNGEGPNVQ